MNPPPGSDTTNLPPDSEPEVESSWPPAVEGDGAGEARDPWDEELEGDGAVDDPDAPTESPYDDEVVYDSEYDSNEAYHPPYEAAGYDPVASEATGKLAGLGGELIGSEAGAPEEGIGAAAELWETAQLAVVDPDWLAATLPAPAEEASDLVGTPDIQYPSDELGPEVETRGPGVDVVAGASRFRRVKWLIPAAACLMLLGGGVAGAAASYDARYRTTMLPGVSIGGLPIGGMRFEAARALVAETFNAPLNQPVTVDVDGTTFSATRRELGLRTDAVKQFDEATRLHGAMPVLFRLWHRITGSPLQRDLDVHRRFDGKGIDEFVDSVAKQVDRPGVDASIRYEGGRLRVTPDVSGFELDRKAAVKQLRAGLAAGESYLRLGGQPVAAVRKSSDLTDVLVVRVGENKLSHYRDEVLVKEYDIATGTSEFPTPLGEFKIVSKRKNPTWINPAKYPGGWGWNLPARIAAGPGNPLGTRALDLSSRGIRIHGTYSVSSIGYNASHGCIRMRIADVEELFELAQVGTPVLVVQTAPLKSPPKKARAEPVEPSAENDGTRIPGATLAPQPSATPSVTPAATPAPATSPTPATSPAPATSPTP